MEEGRQSSDPLEGNLRLHLDVVDYAQQPAEEGAFSFRDASYRREVKAETSASGEAEGSRRGASLFSSSEGSEQNTNKQIKLLRFLERHKLEALFNILLETGYDDLDQLLFQMKSSIPLTLETLESIGIAKVSHRTMLLAALEQAAGFQPREPEEHLSMCCEQNTRAISFHNFHNLREWLGEMGLEALYPQFVDAGYVHLDTILQAMNSSYPLTDELLQSEVKVTRAEDRQKILRRLSQNAAALTRLEEWTGTVLEREGKSPVCACNLM